MFNVMSDYILTAVPRRSFIGTFHFDLYDERGDVVQSFPSLEELTAYVVSEGGQESDVYVRLEDAS
jgi:hypothetical protein